MAKMIVYEYSISEIAKILGISEGRIRQIESEAFEKIKPDLIALGFDIE